MSAEPSSYPVVDPVKNLSRAERAPAIEIPTKPLTQAQIEREQHAFGREAERIWLEVAEKCGSPYTDRAALRQVHDQAISATRWATEAQVLSAIRRRMDIKSSPRRLPEWARLVAADYAQIAHAASVAAERPSEIIEPPRSGGLHALGPAVARIAQQVAS